ncbi:MAG TPA: MbtH family protein [Mesorhizobium sp.]|jgi:MbtH protein|uniref:MbtH family protein n=1 Tax=Mesorhizobium sp. TaxID=1871066 RepID=UPI002DDD0CDC|nr:MbtH family protein [Mesorhizobium sp.]HEV2505497.1 MbtH family protein [Mesorhizobium sp.]
MANPFEDANSTYLVLVNDEGQHSLWPDSTKIPDGWRPIHGPAPRQNCIEYIETHWVDMRPRSLVKLMSQQ